MSFAPSTIDVAIVGAGPAGLAAAAVTARAGLSTLLLDENPLPGGQIYRNVTASAPPLRALLGEDYDAGRALAGDAAASGALILQGMTVWSLDAGLELGLSREGQAMMVRARHVILATGALERPFPIPGWTLPGVMTAGAAQTLLKASGLVPEGRVVLAGLGPLLWLLAAQLQRAGVRISAMLETTPAASYLAALTALPGFLRSPLFAKGLKLQRAVIRKTRIVRGVMRLEAEGEGRLAGVRYETAAGTAHLDADLLLLHQGVTPHVSLAMAAGVAHEWSDLQACFVPVLGEDGATNVPGLSIAGDGGGIAGAEAAAASGRLAAIAAIARLSPGAPSPDAGQARAELARHRRGRRFLDLLYRPDRRFRIPADDVLACRCEEATAGEVREAARLGCTGPNQLKAFLRCGMGPCQGRLCGLTITEIIADERGISPREAGYFRLRAPIKPITLAQMASIPPDPAATRAVERD